MLHGAENIAALGMPLAEPELPLPAMVFTVTLADVALPPIAAQPPVGGTTLRMRLLVKSATNTLEAASTATPLGELKDAPLPILLFQPPVIATPLPATVVTAPLEISILRMLWFF